jgi:DNA-binding MarR family transcriptional regulator
MTYLHESITMEKLEEDKMSEIYFKGMQYYNEEFGNSKYSRMNETQILMMMLMKKMPCNIIDFHEKLGIPKANISPLLVIIIKQGYATYFRDKNKSFYVLTPFALKFLNEQILSKLTEKKENEYDDPDAID